MRLKNDETQTKNANSNSKIENSEFSNKLVQLQAKQLSAEQSELLNTLTTKLARRLLLNSDDYDLR